MRWSSLFGDKGEHLKFSYRSTWYPEHSLGFIFRDDLSRMTSNQLKLKEASLQPYWSD